MAKQAAAKDGELKAEDEKSLVQFVGEVLDRIYFELQNDGRASQARALNYAGSNLYEIMSHWKAHAFRKADF